MAIASAYILNENWIPTMTIRCYKDVNRLQSKWQRLKVTYVEMEAICHIAEADAATFHEVVLKQTATLLPHGSITHTHTYIYIYIYVFI